MEDAAEVEGVAWGGGEVFGKGLVEDGDGIGARDPDESDGT